MKDYFCIIGAQRSGTTYLYKVLDAHPQIEMAKPLKPEPKFFLDESKYNKGKSFYIDKYFSNIRKNVKVIGEKSTSYLEYDLSKKILTYFPNAKIIVILRHPVDRAISNYYFSYNSGLENRTLKEAFIEDIPPPNFDKTEISVSPFDYLKRGLYTNYLKPYLKVFQEKMKIIIFEELVNNKKEVKNILNFLEVDTEVNIDCISESFNRGNYNDVKNLKEVKAHLYDFYQKEIEKVEELKGRKIHKWRLEKTEFQ